jgi:hypothetical protein
MLQKPKFEIQFTDQTILSAMIFGLNNTVTIPADILSSQTHWRPQNW